tara:strand:- start:818 stop:1015 length:198 start_codon:yes stop_codon:yes gene_type:complete
MSQTRAVLKRSDDNEGTLRWKRVSFMMMDHRHDYQSGAPGTNVLFQIHGLPTIHSIEATPIDELP